MVSEAATPSTFQNKDGKYILTYQDGNTQQKFVLTPDSEDKLHVVFMEKFTSYSLSLETTSSPFGIGLPFESPMMQGNMIHHNQIPNEQRKQFGRRECRKMMKQRMTKKLFEELPEL